MHLRLLPAPGVDGFSGPAPAGLRAGWYLLVLRAGRRAPGWIATLRLDWAGNADPGSSDAGPAREVTLAQPFRPRSFALGLLGAKLGVFYVRAPVAALTVRLYAAGAAPDHVALWLLRLPRLLAAAGAGLQNPGLFRTAFAAVSGPLLERIRKAASAAALGGQSVPGTYADWLALFQTWPEARMRAIEDRLVGRPSISALVCHAGPASSPALAATLASLASQRYKASAVVHAGTPDAMGRAATAGTHVAVLQAGEVLPPHALLVLADALGAGADILLADEDRLDADGVRTDPLFKPEPNLAMMCSGLLSRGVWLVPSGLLQQDDPCPRAPWAECLRLDAWFRMRAAGGRVQRVPFVLTHRRADAEAAPPAALAATIGRGLAEAGIDAGVYPDFPLRLRWRSAALAAAKVSLIVPSRLTGATQLACLLDVLAKTTHPNFEMLVVVTQAAPLDPAQQDAARRIGADPRARVECLQRPTFNYSAANNFGAGRTTGAFICLLNDDVSTLEGDWLQRMAAMFSDPSTGVVGAKLYYPNLTTQHGGVIMGLSGLAQHASRFLPRGEPGYAWRGMLDQEMSVVTGACMLVRRTLYEALGGLDESYPTAFNDVDFCLRVRERGFSVIFAGSVELIHHETLSFGHHYGSDAGQEDADVRRMQARWPEVCAADPFHNPNLSLAGQAEWQLAYPPRTDAWPPRIDAWPPRNHAQAPAQPCVAPHANASPRKSADAPAATFVR